MLLGGGGAFPDRAGSDADLLGEGGDLGDLRRGRELLDERVIGGGGDVGRAVDGVGAGGEDAKAVTFRFHRGKFDLESVGPPDPVALHGRDALRPIEAVEPFQQAVGVLRDAEGPLRDLALLDLAPASPAQALLDLLVGEHGVARRAEVHLRAPPVDEPALEHAQEEPLVPAVVRRVAGVDLARPVDGDAKGLHVGLERLDVLRRADPRMQPLLDGGVLGGQAEGVPTERLQHVVAAFPVVAGEHVRDGVHADVSHVHLAGGIREHGEDVLLGSAGASPGAEEVLRFPVPLPAGLDVLRIVPILHPGTSSTGDPPILTLCGGAGRVRYQNGAAWTRSLPARRAIRTKEAAARQGRRSEAARTRGAPRHRGQRSAPLGPAPA